MPGGKRRVYRRPGFWAGAAGLLLIVLVFTSIIRFNQSLEEQRLSSVQTSVKQAVIHCYALEGSYPPNLEYLQQNYGLILDKSRYVYDYRVFASNIAPEVFIFRKSDTAEVKK